METIKKISELETADRAVVERVFGVRLDPSADIVLILKSNGSLPAVPASSDEEDEDGLPKWLNVLQGMSDEDLADFNATLNAPVRFGPPD
jgi:hypothetical protein